MLKLTDLVLEELHSEVELFEGVDLCAEDSSRIENLDFLLRAYSEGHKEITVLREENERLREALVTAIERTQIFLDTFGELSINYSTQADINDWYDVVMLKADLEANK